MPAITRSLLLLLLAVSTLAHIELLFPPVRPIFIQIAFFRARPLITLGFRRESTLNLIPKLLRRICRFTRARFVEIEADEIASILVIIR